MNENSTVPHSSLGMLSHPNPASESHCKHIVFPEPLQLLLFSLDNIHQDVFYNYERAPQVGCIQRGYHSCQL